VPARKVPNDFPAPPKINPNPHGGELVLHTICFADEEHTVGHRHDVIIQEDWSVAVPHELEYERIASALGSYLSCLELVDDTIPAARVFLRRQLRADPPAIIPGNGGRWYLERRAKDCCAGSTSWASPQAAAAHWRSTQHIAAERRTRIDLLSTVAEDLLRARNLREPVSTPLGGRLVGAVVESTKDLHLAWALGLSPDFLEEVHKRAGAMAPLPLHFYLGVAVRKPSLTWVQETAAHVPERADLTWLAWTESKADRNDPTLRRQWLRFGVPRHEIARLSASPYRPEDVRRLAGLIRRSPHTAAGLLARCIDADCLPNVYALAEATRDADAPSDVLTMAAVNRVALECMAVPGTREDMALALLVCGSAPLTVELVQKKKTFDLAELRRGLNEWEQRRQKRGTSRRA
jgi:hypothetical protein